MALASQIQNLPPTPIPPTPPVRPGTGVMVQELIRTGGGHLRPYEHWYDVPEVFEELPGIETWARLLHDILVRSSVTSIEASAAVVDSDSTVAAAADELGVSVGKSDSIAVTTSTLGVGIGVYERIVGTDEDDDS